MRWLRQVGAGLFAVIGAVVAIYAAIEAVKYVSDFIWRWSKGYLSWDMQLSMGTYVISMVAFAATCFIISNSIYRQQLSRRLFWCLGVCVASFVLSVGLLIVGMGSIEGF